VRGFTRRKNNLLDLETIQSLDETIVTKPVDGMARERAHVEGVVVATKSGYKVYHDKQKYQNVAANGLVLECGCSARAKPCLHEATVAFFVLGTDESRYNRPIPEETPSHIRDQGYCDEEDIPVILEKLLEVIQEKPVSRRGRPSIPMRDQVYRAAMQFEDGLSLRRKCLKHKGYAITTKGEIAKDFNATSRFLNREANTHLLEELLLVYAKIGAPYEIGVAFDGTGVRNERHSRYFEKEGKRHSSFLMLSQCSGVRTNLIASLALSQRKDENKTTPGEASQLHPCAEQTKRAFPNLRFTADALHGSRHGYKGLDALGYDLVIKFSKTTGVKAGGVPKFAERALIAKGEPAREAADYAGHQNVESTNRSLKFIYGDRFQSANPQAKLNEALVKAILHNIRMLIHLRAEHPDMGMDFKVAAKEIGEKMVFPSKIEVSPAYYEEIDFPTGQGLHVSASTETKTPLHVA
jgi:hypothetical protein